MNHKKRVSAILLAVYSLGISVAPVLAAEPRKLENDAYDLGEIIISGKTEGVQAAETMHAVTADDIKSMNARTLDQAISLLPGVNIRNGAEGIPRIDVRGFRTRHVLLLLDGIPVNSALDAQFDPTTISTENIAMIKMTAGASSVLYGQGGMGGVINIITKKGTQDLKGAVSLETGDHQPYLGRASLSGKKGDVDFFISGSSTRTDAYPLSDDFRRTSEQTGDYRTNSDRERHNVLGTIGYTPTKDLTLGFTFNYTQGTYGKAASSINDPFDPFAASPKYERIDAYEGLSLQLAADYQATEAFSIRAWAYLNQLSQQDNLYDNSAYNSFASSGSYREKVRTAVHGFTLQPKYDMGRAGVLTVSVNNEWDRWKNSGEVTGNTFDPNRTRDYSIHGIAAEYEVSPFKDLGIVAGYGHHWQVRNEKEDNDFTINAGAHYDLTKDTRLKFSYNRNIRFPSLADLYDVSKGNSDLKAERSQTFQGGIEQQLPYVSSVSLTGFHTVAKNLIQSDQASGRNTNLSEVVYDGFEVAAKTQFLKNLLLRASYTYLDSKDKSRAGRDQLQYTPKNRVTLEGKYDFACGFTPYASFVYVGNQKFYTKNNVTPVQQMALRDYVITNIKLSQRLFKDTLTGYVGIDNLFDRNYETSYGFPQAGRYIYGGVEYRFGI